MTHPVCYMLYTIIQAKIKYDPYLRHCLPIHHSLQTQSCSGLGPECSSNVLGVANPPAVDHLCSI
jgi:hypothetical protein